MSVVPRSDQPEPFVQLSGVGKRYGNVIALAGVNLDIPSGSFTCLVGPSGCGKTTLLRCICGLEDIDAGMVTSGGRDISRMPPAARQMGLVFQSYALFPNLTVARNIAYGLAGKLGRREIERRVEVLLDTVGLSGYGARRPQELSGGQQQRVAIARALAPEPSMLLLDEPLSALDAQLRVQVRAELQALQKQLGVTTVMVTHDQVEALAVADRIAVMDRGRIVQVGAPQNLYCHPENRFVASFLGRMNFLPATVTGGGARLSTGEVLAVHTDGFAVGANVELGIRPEDVVLAADGGGDDAALHVCVLRREFLGGVMRLEAVHSASGAVIALDLPQRFGRTIGENAPIRIVLPPSRIQLFPSGPA